MASFIHSLIAIAMFLMVKIIEYIHKGIIYDRTKKLSDYAPKTVHVAYLTIGCINVLIACLFPHENDVNESNYTPKSQRWWVIEWTKNAFRHVSTGMAKAIDYLDENITLRRRCQLAKVIAFTAKPRKRFNLVRMVAMATVLCHPAGVVDLKQNLSNHYNNIANFDTDSKFSPIGVDNRCSGCISDDIDNFEGPLMTSKRVIKGLEA